jgi:biopolymer transport protein ExbB
MNTVESIKHLFLQAGSSWILWLLALLSVGSLAIAIERWLTFRRGDTNLRALAEGMHARLAEGDVPGAIANLKDSPSVAARVAIAGLRLHHLGPAAVDKAMQSAVALERERMETRLAYLGTVGNNAPFVGLLGTVIGVIMAFEELGHGAAGHGDAVASAAGQVASQAVMSAIAEALVATGVGIAVALPAVAAYNYLQRRVTSLLASTDVLSNLVLAYLLRTKGKVE